MHIANRSGATLVPLLQWWVPTNFTITSDGWSGYNGLQNAGYNHLIVVHKR